MSTDTNGGHGSAQKATNAYMFWRARAMDMSAFRLRWRARMLARHYDALDLGGRVRLAAIRDELRERGEAVSAL